jgi:TetR/AcrR family transcriptional regulator, cholesterol catabolism regulator
VVQNLNGRSKRQEERSIARRLGILRAAAEAFRRYGFADTGMREIAEVAELSTGNLYYYFANKQELLFFCQDYSLDCMIDSAQELSRQKLPAQQRLRRIIERQLRFMLEELDGAAAHLEVDALPVLMRSRIIKKRDSYEAMVRKVIVDGMRTGAFRRVDAGLVTRAILGAINWTARWYRPGGPQPVAEVASAFADYLVRGLLK